MKLARIALRPAASLALLGSLLLAACGSPASPTTSTGPTAPASASGDGAATAAPAEQAAPTAAQSSASGEALKLDIAFNAAQTLPDAANDFVKTTMDQALGTDVQLTLIGDGDDYINQLNVRMAGGNPPDMFGLNRSQMSQFVEKGLLMDLTPYLEKLQPTVAFVGDETLRKGTLNDKVYAIPKSPQVPYNTYWVRKDWLATLGLSAPTTLDDLYDVAVAFTENDPDGNGKKDTYGITGAGGYLGAFAPVFGAYGVGTPGSIYEKDGQLVNAYLDPAMKEALTFINKLVAAGAVDPELAANNALEHRDKAIQGQAGILYIDWPNITKSEFVTQYKTVNPNADWLQLAPITGPGGQNDGVYDIGAAPVMFALPRNLESQPEKVQKIIDLLNYVSTDDGSKLVQFGVEGRHFNLEGDKVVPTELMATEANYSWVYQFTGRPELPYLQTKFEPQTQYIEFAAEQPRIQSLNGFLINPAGYNPADAATYQREQLLAFANGTRPIAEYDAFVDELQNTYGYSIYWESAQEQLKALGFGA